MSVTIKDVAADAGVSTATVSHVINKTRYVSDEISNRVNESIAKLNYYPNHLVGGLRKKQTNSIGVVFPNISNETFGAQVERLQKNFFKLGYNVILCNTSYDAMLEEQALNTLIMKKVDAIICIPVAGFSAKIKEINEMGIPLVLLDRVIEELNIDTVTVDNFKGQYDIVSYLIKQGHKRIGYIDRKLAQSHSREQKNAYLQALNDHGIAYDKNLIINANGHYYESGVEAVTSLMKRCPDITAISAYYDIIAFGAIRGLLDMGYRVPEDISVVGYDGMPFTNYTNPRLTTVLTPIKEIAENICNIVDTRIKNKNQPEHKKADMQISNVIIMPELIIRDSVKKI